MLLTAAAVRIAHAQDAGPRRRADWGFSFASPAPDKGAIVRSVQPASRAAAAGLRTGDRVLTLNGLILADAPALYRAQRLVRGGDTIVAHVVRGQAGDTAVLTFQIDSMPREVLPGTDVAYGWIAGAGGARVRTVVTRPAGSGTTRLPAILFIPWLSCDPVETPRPRGDGYMFTLHAIAARSGFVLMRIEKPGVGDSEGPDCQDTGLADDLAAFRAALRRLRSLPGVNPERIVVMGGSIGGGMAPILAAESPAGVIGVVSLGGFSGSWFEHMLALERRQLTLSGVAAHDVEAAMPRYKRFYADYLIQRHTPAEVIRAEPALASVWSDEPARQYGRAARYYQEVQRLDVLRAWRSLDVPALIVWGEYDWIMSRSDQEASARAVNGKLPGRATLVVLPQTDHGLMRYESALAAFRNEKGTFDDAAPMQVIAWLREVLRTAERGARDR